jgi:hypothetical protein
MVSHFSFIIEVYNYKQAFSTNWLEPANRKDFFDQLGKYLNYKNLEDFYEISIESIKTQGGAALIGHCYDNSVSQAIQDVYCSHSWLEWKFSQRLSSGFWDQQENRKRFLNNLGCELGLKQMNDWYHVTSKQISENGGSSLLEKYGDSPAKLIMSVFSYHNWGSDFVNVK